MCGIVGFTGKRNSQLLKQMLSSIEHRGPDGEGFFEDDNFSIGMRRLAIIDPKSGWQPIWNEDKTVAIVFNGEIYNYRELWEELESLGHRFKSDHSDTETIVHGYEEWGVKILERLRGMFAFALYDLKQNKLFIARDRLGIKPLYYTKVNQTFYFASEIKALLANIELKPQANLAILKEYLLYRTHDHKEQTFFANINKLLPGHYILLSNTGIIETQEAYWHPEVNTEFSSKKTDEQYADELKELFIDSVRSHLISDVPVGVTLSGGLDSTGVVGVMSKLRKENKTDLHTNNLLTFSAVYPNDPIDESRFIDIAANLPGIEQHKITPDVEQFWQEITAWIHTQEEPTISSAPYAIYCVMREAHKYVKVMLSGQGGDELFAGYIPYFATYLTSAKDNLKYIEILRESLLGFDLYYNFFVNKLKSKFNTNQTISISNLINPSVLSDQIAIYQPAHNLSQRLFQDLTQYSIPNVLRYEDKNAMAFSIETRVPFLDHKFVEYVLGLPIDQKIKYGWNRYIYRRAMKGIIPEEIRLRRKKIGFTTPEVRWMRTKAQQILTIFNSLDFKQYNLFNQEQVVKDFTAWLNHTKTGDAMTFWRILNTYLWLKHFKITI